ncbi:hypothetical protein L6R52_04735 [Myxococcota bacterium]|nr:hypothetical protein [Myxococcota bacterium]
MKLTVLALLLAAQTAPQPTNQAELPEGETPEVSSTETPAAPEGTTEEPTKVEEKTTEPVVASPTPSEPVPATKEPAQPEPDASAAPQADDFFQFSDFVDTRVTFALSNINVFAGPGERLGPTSGYRIGVDRGFPLFLENVNTRFSGYESLSHIVLYKKLPGFWKYWETETALAALVLADTDSGRFSFYDSGTYLRVIRKLDEGKEEKVGSFDFTAWPVSADRFRLGYTYIISWGGTAIFPGKLQSSSITEGAVPGFRLRYRAPDGKAYGFVGAKSALLLSREAGVKAGEQVPNYGMLAGGGIELEKSLILELNGGFFQKGTQERTGLEGRRIYAYGASARATFYQGNPTRQSSDFRLYRNDPTDPVDYLLYQEYRPGTGYSIALEGTVLGQNLEDPDQFASEKIVPAMNAGLVAVAKLEETTLRLDAFFQSVDFLLFNVPGFVPFQGIPAGATTTPEFFLSGTVEYALPEWKLRPSLSLGIKVPATYQGVVPEEQGNIGGATTGEVRTQVIVDEVTRIVLPPGTSATPIIGAVLKVPLALSRSTAIAFESRFELNDNQPRIAQDNELGEVTYQFDSPARLSLGLVLQSRW